jgi:hypothetical protein
MKTICAMFVLLFAVHCASVQEKTKDILNADDQIIDIKYDNSSSKSAINFTQNDETQILTLKNKSKTWKITYKDFKIMTLGYKNWRVVENVKPEISKITEDSNWLNFTFNYYKTIEASDGTTAKISILSGTVSLNKKVVRTNEEEANKKNMKWWIVGLSSYSVLITTVLLIIVL